MFVFQAQEFYPELVVKARRALSFDDLIAYLAGCDTKEQVYNFLSKFDWENTLRSTVKPEITVEKVIEQWSENYQGYTEKTTHFCGLYCGRKVEAALTVHNHEDGNIEYFFAWRGV
jgi:hypothetical protein